MPEDATQIDIGYVAHLARLHLTDEEKARYAVQLHDILKYVAKLNEVDVTDVEPTAHAMPRTNVWRKDEVKPSLDSAKALANAPRSARGLFIVPPILE